MTPRRIAMWSGPRNISTALMRSWENRPDTAVVDEPLYAHYLLKTGIPHPAADKVIRSQETDWRKVVEQLTTGDIPGGKTIYYQKHMTHHLLRQADVLQPRLARLLDERRHDLARLAQQEHVVQAVQPLAAEALEGPPRLGLGHGQEVRHADILVEFLALVLGEGGLLRPR